MVGVGPSPYVSPYPAQGAGGPCVKQGKEGERWVDRRVGQDVFFCSLLVGARR